MKSSGERQDAQPRRERRRPDRSSGLHRRNGPLDREKPWLTALVDQVSAGLSFRLAKQCECLFSSGRGESPSAQVRTYSSLGVVLFKRKLLDQQLTFIDRPIVLQAQSFALNGCDLRGGNSDICLANLKTTFKVATDSRWNYVMLAGPVRVLTFVLTVIHNSLVLLRAFPLHNSNINFPKTSAFLQSHCFYSNINIAIID